MNKANISGRHIQSVRKESNMTQMELAAALDVDFGLKLDRSDISEIENGIRGVRDYELKAIATILNTSYGRLLLEEEDAPSNQSS